MLVYCSNNKTEKQHSLKVRYFIKITKWELLYTITLMEQLICPCYIYCFQPRLMKTQLTNFGPQNVLGMLVYGSKKPKKNVLRALDIGSTSK